MNLRKIGVVLLALLLAGMAMIPMISAAENQKSTIKILFQPVDSEAKKVVNRESVDIKKDQSKNLDETALKLTKKYDKELSQIIKELEEKTGKKIPEEQIEEFKLLLVREHLHNLYRESVTEQMKENETNIIEMTPIVGKITSENGQSYQEYSIASSIYNPYPINNWRQVTHDITGGVGMDNGGYAYAVNGHNDLYYIKIYVNPSRVHYELYWYDEDRPDPVQDAAYDAWRLAYYGRIIDIQSFDIQNNQIIFSDIGDEGRTYANPTWGHGYLTRQYSGSTTIFVSNVWNHAMDTSDRNSWLGKTYMYPPTNVVSG